MRTKLLTLAAFTIALGTSGVASATWSVEKSPFGDGYVVRHDSGSSDLVVNTRYKSKKAADKAAKTLNKAEDRAESDEDNEEGGEK